MSNPQNKEKPSENLLLLADKVIQQSHYLHLDRAPLVAVDNKIKGLSGGSIVCLFQVKELVFNKEKGCLEAVSVIMNALHACGASCLMILEYREGSAELYLGAVNKIRFQNMHYLNTIRDILRSGLQGNLPGTEITELVSREEIDHKIDECLGESFDTQCITSVSCVADQFKDDKPSHGMERLLGAIGKKNFTLMVLADSIDTDQLQTIRLGYEELSSQLSELESVSVSMQTGRNTSFSTSTSDSVSTSLSESISYTQSHNISTGWNEGESSPEKGKGTLGKKAAAGAVALSIASMADPMAGYMFMNVVSPLISGGSVNTGKNNSVSDGESKGHSESRQLGDSHQEGQSVSTGETEGMSLQYTRKNRHVQDLLGRIDSYLKWINKCENYGMFNCCAYIISGNAGTNLMVSSQYQALLQGEGERGQPVTFNTWTKENGIDYVRDSLKHLMHPLIKQGEVETSPAMLTSSKDLARQMILPQESIVGVSVMEYAAFGREVVRKNRAGYGKVARIGSVTHMGKVNKDQPVYLDLQSLAAHTFVAGTNGSGKSNTIFCLLEELMAAKIPFMVIEPAKGEYKNVFGKEPGVLVLGTNKQKTPVLRINPFWFNEDVNIKEHIARLMDVFNASWPMYAAMPSILNSAIENAYLSCGWNLATSKCSKTRIFPTVKDVQAALHEKMESTAFSDEVRGNYVGALSTRLESLNSGLYTEIFSGADTGDEILFNNNVLIDLSRAGSPEISAMIMGVILIRLREYRMSEGAINHPLRHVTVLEEAHHLLRRTSLEQSSEGSNMMGKAVEMISNAIAEMRSYGDGFIIVDQSPGLLDLSVLRNTNTKIIMRLPEGGDRELVGNTIGLNTKQVYELSRLNTGVAVVYQKDWLEAILCKIDLAKHKDEIFQYYPVPDEEDHRHRTLLKMLCEIANGNPVDVGRFHETIRQSALDGRLKRELLSIRLDSDASKRKLKKLLLEIEPLNLSLPDDFSEEELSEWYAEIVSVNDLPDDETTKAVIQVTVQKKAEQDSSCDKVLNWLGGDREAAQLQKIRGAAFSWILFDNEDAAAERMLRDDELDALDAGWDADRQLCTLYRKYLERGERRKRGEIFPYCELAWEYGGGDYQWVSAFPYIIGLDFERWHACVSQELRYHIDASDKVITALMSLLLQNRGSNEKVHAFYYKWLAWVQSKNGN